MTHIWNAIQQLLILLDIALPSSLMQADYGDAVWRYVRAVFHVAPWIFSSDNFLFDAACFLCLFVIATLAIVIIGIRADRKIYIGYSSLLFVKHFQLGFCQLVAFPLFWRFGLAVESVTTAVSTTGIVTVVLYVLDLSFLLFHIHLISIFLLPVSFVRHSKLDLYDGKNYMELYIVRLVMTLCLGFFRMLSSDTERFIVFGVTFVLVVLCYYFRLVTTVHVTVLGQWLEMAPVSATPFVLLFNTYRSNWIENMVFVLCLYVAFAVIFFFHHKMMVKQSFKVFKPFLRQDVENEELPRFVPGSLSSVLRIVAVEMGNPDVFVRFLSIQKREKCKTSYIIEAARFLSLFPSKRAKVLEELRAVKSNNDHNAFLLYLFRKKLEVIDGTIRVQDQQELAELQRSYLIHFHLYWRARKEKKWLWAFREALSVAYYYREAYVAFHSAVTRCPFDPCVHMQVGDFKLGACGDYEGYRLELQIVAQLEAGKSGVLDPFLHPMLAINPKVLPFCTEEEMSANLSTNSTSSSMKPSNTNSSGSKPFQLGKSFALPLNDTSATTETSYKQKPMASYLKRSTRCVPALAIFHFIVPVIFLLTYIGFTCPQEILMRKKVAAIDIAIANMTSEFEKSASLMYLPYVFYGWTSLGTGDCRLDLAKMPADLFSIYQDLGILRRYTAGMIIGVLHEVAWGMSSQRDLCLDLRNLQAAIERKCASHAYDTTSYLNLMMRETRTLRDREERYYYIVPTLVLIVILSVIVVLLSMFILFIQVNVIMRKANIEYLASIDRLSRLIFQKGEDAWELLRKSSSADVTVKEGSPTPTTSQGPVSTSSRSIEAPGNSSASVRAPRSPLQNSAFSVMAPLEDRLPAKTPLTQLSSQSSYERLPTTSDQSAAEMSTDDTGQLSPRSENIETDPIEQAIESVQLKDKCTFCNVIMQMLWPFLLVCIGFGIVYFPISDRLGKRIARTDEVFSVERQLNASIFLLWYVYQQSMEYRQLTREFLERIDADLRGAQTEITDLYTKRQCFDLLRVECGRMSDMIWDMIDPSVSRYRMHNVYLPVFMTLAQFSATEAVSRRVDALLALGLSNETSFIVAISLICAFFLVYGFIWSNRIREGFNSIYHYPRWITKRQPKGNERIKKQLRAENMPSNAIIVTTIAETGEIYSVTENTKLIIHRTALDMIGRKFHKLFPVIDKEKRIREHLLPDNKTTKTFKYRSKRVGDVYQTVMVEERVPGQMKRSENVRNVTMRMVSFLPLYFAKLFCEEDQTNFEFHDSFVILLRIDPNLVLIKLDKLFNIANMLTQNYRHIHIFNMDGGTISFITEKDAGPLIPLLFIRDILSECQAAMKGTNQLAAYSFFVSYKESVNMMIADINQPYLENDIADLNGFQFMLYQLKSGCVCFDERATARIPGIADTATQEVIRCDLNGGEQQVHVLPFKQMTTEFMLSLRT